MIYPYRTPWATPCDSDGKVRSTGISGDGFLLYSSAYRIMGIRGETVLLTLGSTVAVP